MLYATRK